MKKMFLALLLVVGLIAGCAQEANATPIFINDTNAGVFNGDDVGGVDTLVSTTGVLSGIAAETAWVNSIISPDSASFTLKIEPVNYFDTTSAGVFAFDLSANDDYFIVKNAQKTALYANLMNVDWGVFDVGLLDSGFNLGNGDYQISHVTEFSSDGGGSNSVPEPSVLALMGLGLLGTVGVTRRKKNMGC